MINEILRIGVLASIAHATVAISAELEEYIDYDSGTGNYVIWENVDGVLEPAIFEPSTKIDPKVSVRIKKEDGQITYDYTISNSPSAEQAVELASVDVSSVERVAARSSKWDPYMLDTLETSLTRMGIGYWGDEPLGGIAPGNKLSFTASSRDLAGVGTIRLQGAAPILTFKGHGVGPVLQDELDSIALPENNSVARYTLVPAIRAQTHFSAEIVLRGMADHVEELHKQHSLNPVFASRLTNSLLAAADALSRGNWSGAMQNLGMATRVLGSAQRRDNVYDGDNIEQLLARAFQFNIGYIRSETARMRNQ